MGTKYVAPDSIKDCNISFISALKIYCAEIAVRYEEHYARRLDVGIVNGRKFIKVVTKTSGESVHSFIDKKTGDIYKAASWRAPAQIVRGNIYIKGGADAFAGSDWQIRYL